MLKTHSSKHTEF